jgi:hypothetical protein
MRDRRLTPTRRRALPAMSAKREDPLGRQCPLADPLAAASRKVRRKRGQESLGTMMPSCLPLAHGGVAFSYRASQEFFDASPSTTGVTQATMAHRTTKLVGDA